jgi:hypothetical protein
MKPRLSIDTAAANPLAGPRISGAFVQLRELTLQRAAAAARPRCLSAASGLVCAHGRAYVIADDELELAVFDDLHTPGRSWPLFAGRLPQAPAARKRRKPDTETLLLPACSTAPHGTLLTLSSGSPRQRCRAACITLGRGGEPITPPRLIDLAPLYDPLRRHFADLNIEGAFVTRDTLVLLQRGHGGGSASASLHYPRAAMLAWLHHTRGRPPAPTQLRLHDLGQMQGVPLGFTDGAALPDGRWLFTAVADGACLGSVVGVMSRSGHVQSMHALPGNPKVEGIALRSTSAGVDLCLVTDADDPRVPSRLLRGWLGWA